MLGDAFRVDEFPHNLHEADGVYLATLHQLICCGVFGWHPDLQLDLGRSPPLNSTGLPKP